MTSEAFEKTPTSYRSRALNAAGITVVAQGFIVAAQMSSVIVLGRLLTPDDFGLMAMATPLFSLIALFQDLGLTQAVVQAPDFSRQDSNALFWINVAVSIALSLLLVSLAPLARSYYHEPRIFDITLALAGIVGIIGIGLQPRALLNRHLQFGRLAFLDASGAVLNLVFSVIFALWLRNYWALVLGWGIATAVTTVSALLLAGFAPSMPRASRDTFRFLKFGAGVTSYNFINYFYRNTDNLLIGRFWGMEALGLYDRAYKLLLLPTRLITNPLSRVMVPILSRLASEDERYSAAFLRALRQVLLVTTPGVAFAVGTATVLVPTLLGQQWADAGPIFAMMGCAAPLELLDGSAGWLLISQGRVRDYLVVGVVSAVMAITGFVLGLPQGALGVARAYAISNALKEPLLWWWVTRSGPLKGREVAPIIVTSLGVFGIAVAASAGTLQWNGLSPLPRLALALVASYAASLVFLLSLPSGRATLRETLALASTMRRGR